MDLGQQCKKEQQMKKLILALIATLCLIGCNPGGESIDTIKEIYENYK